MAKTLFKISTQKIIVELCWSKDWFSIVPWATEDKNLPYFSKEFETNGSVNIRVFYAGPFALIVGNWTG